MIVRLAREPDIKAAMSSSKSPNKDSVQKMQKPLPCCPHKCCTGWGTATMVSMPMHMPPNAAA